MAGLEVLQQQCQSLAALTKPAVRGFLLTYPRLSKYPQTFRLLCNVAARKPGLAPAPASPTFPAHHADKETVGPKRNSDTAGSCFPRCQDNTPRPPRRERVRMSSGSSMRSSTECRPASIAARRRTL